MSSEPLDAAMPAPFRACGSCLKEWASWHDFVLDPQIRLLGLQSVPSTPDGSLLVFDHGCGTSISVPVNRVRPHLQDLEVEPCTPARIGYEECRRHCEELEDLAACHRPCVRARDRRLVQMILQYQQASR
jgi:hypothetical protein